MNDRDCQLVRHIKEHHNELQYELSLINGFEEYLSNKIINKAIKMDLLQIGENVNHFTKEVQAQLNKKDFIGIIDIRNQVAHGYVQIKEELIWNTIQKDVPRLMQQIDSLKQPLSDQRIQSVAFSFTH